MHQCAFFGEDARFHHVGLAVSSIREASPAAEILENRTQGVREAFLRLNGVTIELLEPLGDRSPIAASVEKGLKLLHLCYEVPDLDRALRLSRRAGFHRLGPPVAVPEFEGRRIAWVFSRQFGLFELVEAKAAG
jgi:methylmalonyl-CoA/ethylmalonyl-CoA epimerase